MYPLTSTNEPIPFQFYPKCLPQSQVLNDHHKETMHYIFNGPTLPSNCENHRDR